MSKNTVDIIVWGVVALVVGLPLGYLLGAISDWVKHKLASVAVSDALIESKVRVEVDSEHGVGLPLVPLSADEMLEGIRDRRASVRPTRERRVRQRRASGSVVPLVLFVLFVVAFTVAYVAWMNGYRPGQ
jgi:hypothetical protein